MKRLCALLFLVPAVLSAHPLPPNYCNTLTILDRCIKTCKTPTGSQAVLCLDKCLTTTTCATLAASNKLKIAKALPATDLVGTWTGNMDISSEYGQTTIPVSLVITSTSGGRFNGALTLDVGSVGLTFHNIPVYSALTDQGNGLWDVSMAGNLGINGQGTYTETTPGTPTFTLEIRSSSASSNDDELNFKEPFNGSVVLTKQ